MDLRRRTVERFADDAGATALDYVADWIAAGNTLTALAKQLGVSTTLVSAYLRREYGADLTRDTLRAAREHGAHVLTDQSLDIADAATPETVNVARVQIATRQWTAERWNARELGAKTANVAVQVNVGALMLEALRQPVATLQPATENAIAEQADVLSIESAST